MKNYIAETPMDALKQAHSDPEMGWTKAELRALKFVIDGEDTWQYRHGTGLVWGTKHSKIHFGTHDTKNGYNVWRT